MVSQFETGCGNSVVEHLYFCFAEMKKMKLITGVNYGSRKPGFVDVCHKG